MRGNYCYFAFGLRIKSEVALPELAPFARDDFGAPDVTIRFDTIEVPDVTPAGSLRIAGEDVFLTVESTAHFRVRGGREIALSPLPGASERNVRLFLLGSAFGILCHRRGLLPLHANAVVADGKAVAFAGRTGVGKSTLAAHFQSRGFEILCDDVCVISFDDAGRPLAWPGLPRLKLWRDAVEALGHDSENLERAIDGMEKFHVPLSAAASQGPYPLSRVYVLQNLAEGQTPRVERLTGKDALQSVMTNTYRKNFVSALGLAKENFLMAAAVVRHAGVYTAPRRRGFDVFDDEALRLERHFIDAAADGAPLAFGEAGF